MTEGDIEFLNDLGISMRGYKLFHYDDGTEAMQAEVVINMEQFGPMRRHCFFIKAIAESQNQEVIDLYGQLITLALLTEKKND